MTTPRPHQPHHHDDDPTGVRDLLSSLPDPGPMPDDLVARISDALEAERRAHGGATRAPIAPAVSLDRARARRRRFATIGLAAAAAAGVVGVAGTGLLTHVRSTDTAAHVSLASAPGGPSSDAAASAAGAAAPSAADEAGDAQATTRPDVQIRLSATPSDGGDLATYGRSLLATRWSPKTPHTVEQPTVGPIGTEEGVLECLSGFHTPTRERVAAEITTYRGRPAVVIAVADKDLRAVTVQVAARPCVPDNALLLAGPVTSRR